MPIKKAVFSTKKYFCGFTVKISLNPNDKKQLGDLTAVYDRLCFVSLYELYRFQQINDKNYFKSRMKKKNDKMKNYWGNLMFLSNEHFLENKWLFDNFNDCFMRIWIAELKGFIKGFFNFISVLRLQQWFICELIHSPPLPFRQSKP